MSLKEILYGIVLIILVEFLINSINMMSSQLMAGLAIVFCLMLHKLAVGQRMRR